MSALRRREDVEREEGERFCAAAAHSAERGDRLHPEPEHAYRTAFQRDRDRIVHARAFRRLQYKTQVFVYHEGDHYRNRLTHTLEAAQISRTIARALRLNEDLAEAVVLAHDLGHTAFGHAGERVLARLMREDGGFDHNRQSLRIVDWLEERTPRFRGLNLTRETREGILKHGCRWEHPVPIPELGAQPSLEAQVADRADEIAYSVHDLDDGLRSGLLEPAELEDLPLWREARERVEAGGDGGSPRLLGRPIIAALIDRLVTDLVEASAARVEASGVESLAALRATPGRLVGPSSELAKAVRELKGFLHRELYLHPRVAETSARAEQILGDLFGRYRAEPEQLPPQVRQRFAEDGAARATADYVAGMTDRFAIDEHRQAFGSSAVPA